MSSPVICFGQQPCGFFPRRFLYAKFVTARRLQQEIGGEVVFFYHDSDHDPRETQTTLRHRKTGEPATLNFTFTNKVQRRWSPLYAKRIPADWPAHMARQLGAYVGAPDAAVFKQVKADTVADFCLEMYRGLGLLEGVRVVRSGDPAVRRAACEVADCFVDVTHEGETVRARRMPDGSFCLHEGGDSYVTLPPAGFAREQVSPSRDTRLRWMQSVIHCTHYIAGAGEQAYLNQADAPEITFLNRDPIDRSDEAWIHDPVDRTPLVAFGAHPDDIEFGCGGIIARESHAGRPVHFVVCSRGEAGTNGTPAVRTKEAQAAAKLLGATIEFLELDGDAHLEIRSAHALKLAAILRRVRPALVLAPTLAQNQHPDHWRLGTMVRDATRLARYGGVAELRALTAHAIGELFFYALGPGAEPLGQTPVLIDISAPEVMKTWTAAMEAHASQMRTRNYVELQLARARVHGLNAGVGHAQPLWPNDPLVFTSLAPLSRAAAKF